MHLIIGSREDEASMSMSRHLLGTVDFSPWDQAPGVLQHGDYLFSYIDGKHLYLDSFSDAFGNIQDRIEDVIFLSKHSSSADIKSLTVHPTGNFGEAKLGGRPGKLSVSNPARMSSTLRAMNELYSGPDFSVTFEATHHGPLMEIPNFFIEIGTTKEQWENTEALDTVVKSLFSDPHPGNGSFVGAGGGHYMPKVTRYCIDNNVDIGHMISKHALENATEELIGQAVEKTPGCRGFVLDRKGVKSAAKQMFREYSDINGLEIILV